MGETVVARGPGRPRAFSTLDVLDAAVEVFARQGYERTSLSDLTAAMGITRPSLYLAFGNKDQLFLAAMKRHQAQAEQHLNECLSLPSARAGVEMLLQSWVATVTDPAALGTCFVTQSPLRSDGTSDDLASEFEACRDSVRIALADRLDRARAEGEISADADTQALGRFYSLTIQGIALDAQHGGTKEELAAAASTAMMAFPAQSPRYRP